MKTIFTFCIGVFVPFLLLCQNPLSNTLIDKPYLVVDNENKVYEKMHSVYKAYSKFTESQSRAPLSIKQKLDSIINTPTDSSLAAHKSVFTYNTNGNITSSAEYDWDMTSQNFIISPNSTKTEWTYNSNHRISEYITYYGDQQIWNNDLKYVNTYDQYGRLTNVISSSWMNNQWEQGLKIENTYDEIGRDTLSVYYYWDGATTWNPADKYEYNYINDNLIITHSTWMTKWVYSDKEEISYYVFGPEHVHTFYQWDGSGDWANYYQSIANYTNNSGIDILTNFTEYLWDVISVIWVNSRKTDYRYDNDINMYQNIYYKYVKQLQGYIIDSKEDCAYQNQYKHDDLLLPPNLKFTLTLPRNPDNDVFFNHMITKSSNSIYNGSTYFSNNTKTFYYSPINVTKTIDNNAILNSQIVPNPASDYFTIVSDDLTTTVGFKLFDLNGKLKISKKINSNDAILTESLSKGIYLYRIFLNNKNLQSGKLIVN